ncbi:MULTISPECIES: RNA polymerase sigma factor [Methylomonas]|uniref:RNA polymerase subunit sigma-24 n=2 Tax=Methylomonas TaxID=416 RepID=A0A126T1Q0_9GAMM|nr:MULTISPECIES: RNA polymerase sigma factor [Methylomonas]AMK76010.1 RNA polymerase subunit sigma-24 [Methylomonas denitrificans]OAH99856.1 RNA polymerase subunit sigma-24 [Methylomonas methanica]TCV83970.1 RNA polymerase RpoE-like sigma-24 subunit [Methylomonas methanica]
MSVIAIQHDQIAELFLNHKEAIVDFLIQKVKCPDTAQDLSQETYLRLLRKDSLAHTENLTGYLFRTAERLSIDFIRQHQRSGAKAQTLDDELACPHIQPEDFAILSQQCERLLLAIASLPRQCRHILLLRKIDELSYAQVAEQLGISEKTVQRQLVKAMLHCHQMLNDPQH